MPKFKKVLLTPGTYQSPDGEISISPERIKHWSQQFKTMKGAGLSIPLPWGHTDLDPNQKEYFESKFNAGFLDDLGVSEKDELYGIFDVPLEQDAEKIGTTIREVSPQIETKWRDGKGRIWDDVITHVALVTHPVVPGQSNFETVKLRLSLNMKVDEDMAKDTDKKDDKEKDKKPNPFEKGDKKDDKGGKKEDKEGGSEVVHEDKTKGGINPSLRDALEKVGLVLPEDVTDKTLPEALEAAALTLAAKLDELGEGTGGSKGTEGAGGEDDVDLEKLLGGLGGEEGKEGGAEGATPEQTEEPSEVQDQTDKTKKKKETPEEVPPTMTLSLNKALEDTKKRLSLAEKQLEDQTRERLARDAKELLDSGRITPVMYQKLTAQVGKYKMSLNDKGAKDTTLEDKISLLQDLPIGGAWTPDERVRMSNAQEQQLPLDFEQFDDKKADRLADEQLKITGRSQFTLNL